MSELTVGADGIGQPVLMSLEEVLSRFSVSGVSVAVLEDGRLIDSAGFGFASSDVPMSEVSVGLAGSTSKMIAAAGALVLAEQGVFDLDCDVNGLLSSWQVPARDGWTAAPTIRQILAHTAGFTVHGFTGYPRGEPVPTLIEVLTGTGPATNLPVTVDFVPGTAMRYSGGGFVVLAQVIEDVTGRPFAEIMHEAVLGPCGMDNSSFANPPVGNPSVRSSGHHSSGVEVRGGHYVYPESAAAGLWSTARDLGLFIGAVQRAIQGESGHGVSRAVAEGLTIPQFGGRTLGASIVAGCLSHAGANVGHVSSALGAVNGRFGLAFMSNSDLGLSVFPWINAAVAKARGWPWPPAPPSASSSETAARPPIGHYEIEGIGHLTVAYADEFLVIRFNQQLPITLTPGNGAWCHDGLPLTASWEPGENALTLRQSTGSLIAHPSEG